MPGKPRDTRTPEPMGRGPGPQYCGEGPPQATQLTTNPEFRISEIPGLGQTEPTQAKRPP